MDLNTNKNQGQIIPDSLKAHSGMWLSVFCQVQEISGAPSLSLLMELWKPGKGNLSPVELCFPLQDLYIKVTYAKFVTIFF